jgi:hypothetical protein
LIKDTDSEEALVKFQILWKLGSKMAKSQRDGGKDSFADMSMNW